MKHLGDITKVSGFDAPPVSVIVGGSPCQDLSVAGLRKGLKHEGNGDDETTRSGLFIEQVRIVKEMRKKWREANGSNEYIRFHCPGRLPVWENVVGALSSRDGEDFRCVLEELARVVEEGIVIPRCEKGKWETSGCIIGDKWSIAWRVIDAQYFVPQRRRRICLVADFDGYTAPEIVFEYQHNGDDEQPEGLPLDGCVGTGCGREIQSLSEGLSRDIEQGGKERKEASRMVGRT